MAWNKVTDINYTQQPNPHLKEGYPAMVTGHYYIKFVGTLWVDSGNAAHYRVRATMSVAPYKSKYGGEWSRNDGKGIDVYFNDADGEHHIMHQDISKSSYTISAWKEAGVYATVDTIDTEFTISKKGTLNLHIQLYHSGAGRVGSNSWKVDEKTVTSSDGFSGNYYNFINYEVPDPYKKPSITLNSVTEIGKLGDDSYTVDYSVTKGTNNLSSTYAIIESPSKSYNLNTTSTGNNIKKSFKPAKADYDYGKSYKVAVRINDGKNNITSGYKTWRTYQMPTLDDSLIIDRTAQHANQTNKFTLSGTNNRAYSAYENPFVTRYRIKVDNGSYGSWTSIGNVSSWSRNASEMRTLVPKSNDAKTITIQFERWSTKLNTSTTIYESSNKPSKSFVVYYRPQLTVVNGNTTYKNSSGTTISKGQIIAEDKLTDITVSWTFDTDQAKAGYTQGYRVRLYNNTGTMINDYYTTSKSCVIPKNDIPKDGLLSYIDITPYFGNDQASNASKTYKNNYWYYNGTISKFNFIIVAARLKAPGITYPINGSTWINDDFRICFQLPEDPNKASVSGTYKYDNIEFEINNKVYKMANTDGTTSGATLISNNYTFSTLVSNLTYQKKVIIWPNANNITKNTTYKMRVRVRKPYNATADTYWGWGEWSGYVTITKQVPSYSVSKDQLILASHYNEVRNAVENAKNTYAITGTVPDRAVSRTTIIKQDQYYYNNIFKRIVETKDRVNNYTGETIPTSLQQVKFDYTNKIITSFTTSKEFVTAAKDGTNGKNYMKYIYDNVILLK